MSWHTWNWGYTHSHTTYSKIQLKKQILSNTREVTQSFNCNSKWGHWEFQKQQLEQLQSMGSGVSLLGQTSLTQPSLAVFPWTRFLASLGIWALLVNEAIITLPLGALWRIMWDRLCKVINMVPAHRAHETSATLIIIFINIILIRNLEKSVGTCGRTEVWATTRLSLTSEI